MIERQLPVVGRLAPRTVDVLSREQTSRAAKLLFDARYDTAMIAALFCCSEPEIVSLIDHARSRQGEAPPAIEVRR